MMSIENVYIKFNEARASKLNKKFKKPKNWESKLLPDQIQIFAQISGYFLTKWSNINVKRYMECGFELYKRFTYKDILRPDIIKHYIETDKIKKRRINTSLKKIDSSFRYIEKSLKHYCNLHEGARSVIINDYLKNKIDTMILVYCIYYKYLIISKDEKELLYNIYGKYDEIVNKMFNIEYYIKDKCDEYKIKR